MEKLMLEEINRQMEMDPIGFVAECEAEYSREIFEAADLIRQRRRECPLVLLSGPSGSGKTTAASQMEDQLRRWGISSLSLSMDNYFFPLREEEAPRDEDGNVDFESPLCLDKDFLSQHVTDLIRGREIRPPKFDFVHKKRLFQDEPIRLPKGDILVIEGIHALNPEVTGDIEEYAVGMYISMRTRIQRPDGTLIKPGHLRAIRRIIRDHTHRGKNAAQTAAAWESVRRGEYLYIRPHKGHADISINTLIPYEGCVTCRLAKPLLEASRRELEESQRGRELLELSEFFFPMEESIVPKASLLNEFLGT